MKNESYYFSHDYNARNDRKLVKVKLKFRMLGVGVYWSLVEMLYEENGKISLSDVPVIAADLREKESIILSIIKDFDLFQNDGIFFWSNSVNCRLDKRLEKVEKAKASAQIRWGNATAMRTHSESNAIKERKGKEIKEKESKEERVNIPFNDFWNLYDKKIGDKNKLEKKWNNLTDEERDLAINFIPKYKESQPEKFYRKNVETFLNNKSWNDEIVTKKNEINGTAKKPESFITSKNESAYEFLEKARTVIKPDTG